MSLESVEQKSHYVLRWILLIFCLIVLRVGYLSLIAHDEHVALAEKPRRREELSLPMRGTISDRFGQPIAVNRIKYDAAILYDQIREVPFVRNKKISWRKKEKIYPRKEYITKLATFLSEELKLDSQYIEDVIYSRASLFPNTPFNLKEDIDEVTFYRLKAREKDFPGIHMQIGSMRYYPQGKVGCDVVGYLGRINEGKYLAVAEETRLLQSYLEECEIGHAPPLPKGFASIEQVNQRLAKLKEKAYTLNAQVGKGGVEGFFDESLRGSLGKNYYEVDIRGRILRELEGGYAPKNGESLTLAISNELQEYAEQLLAFSETLREERFEGAGKDHSLVPSPWIKGGAIVAMIPQTGEIVAMASCPQFDPNDFIGRKSQINLHKWLESRDHLGAIWDGRAFLERETYSFSKKCAVQEREILNWETYLNLILSKTSPIKEALEKIESIDVAILHQRDPIELFDTPEEEALFQDLLSLLVDESLFNDKQLMLGAGLSPSDYRSLCQAKVTVEQELRDHIRFFFHKIDFQTWRSLNFKDYLKNKRKKEKEEHRVNKPYLDYLEKKEKKLFARFWQEHRLTLLTALLSAESLPEPLQDYQSALSTFKTDYPAYFERLKGLPSFDLLSTMLSYQELEKPLRQPYRHTPKKEPKLQDLAIAYCPSHFGYLSSEAFNQATPQGSIFKVVTALEGLRQSYQKNPQELNPMTIIDDLQEGSKTTSGQILGYTLDGKSITRQYKGGTLPRSRPQIGKVDLKMAIERSSNIYFSLLAGDLLSHPLDLIRASKELGFGKKTGIDLPGEYRGLLPHDLRENRTGLYALAIGQHSLVVTPLQTAAMFSTIANGGLLLKPQIIKKESPDIRAKIALPDPIRRYLMEAMSLVINGEKGSARPSRIRTLYDHPPFLRHYLDVRKTLVGKTSTAEINYRPTLDPHMAPIKAKHIWFGGVAFEDTAYTTPELAVVVYLKFGDYGKEAAPLAAEIVHKWREIKEKRTSLTSAQSP